LKLIKPEDFNGILNIVNNADDDAILVGVGPGSDDDDDDDVDDDDALRPLIPPAHSLFPPLSPIPPFLQA